MHDTYIGGRSENHIKCIVVHNDLGRKNRTTRYNCRFSAASLVLRVIFSVSQLWNIFGFRFFHEALQLWSDFDSPAAWLRLDFNSDHATTIQRPTSRSGYCTAAKINSSAWLPLAG